MKLFVNGVYVAELPVKARTSGHTIALEDIEIAIETDVEEDRTKAEAYLDTAQQFQFVGNAGTYWAGYLGKDRGWCAWAEGALTTLKEKMEREAAISLAFESSWSAPAGGLS